MTSFLDFKLLYNIIIVKSVIFKIIHIIMLINTYRIVDRKGLISVYLIVCVDLADYFSVFSVIQTASRIFERIAF